MFVKRTVFSITLSTGWACLSMVSRVLVWGGMRLPASLAAAVVATAATALEATTLLTAAALIMEEGAKALMMTTMVVAPAGALPARFFESVKIQTYFSCGSGSQRVCEPASFVFQLLAL